MYVSYEIGQRGGWGHQEWSNISVQTNIRALKSWINQHKPSFEYYGYHYITSC
jgi:hypothetical protein